MIREEPATLELPRPCENSFPQSAGNPGGREEHYAQIPEQYTELSASSRPRWNDKRGSANFLTFLIDLSIHERLNLWPISHVSAATQYLMKTIPLLLCSLFLTPYFASAESAASTNIPGLGSVTDPVGDCKIEGDAKLLTIAIPAGDHALVIEQNRMTAPRVLQSVSGDFTAQVTVSGTYPDNATTIVPGRRAFQGAGLLLWVGPDTYIRLERGHLKIEGQGTVQHFDYPSWELRFAGKPLRMGSGNEGAFTSAEAYLRLTRTGNKVTASISDDGTTWRDLDPVTVKLPETVQIGLVAGHNTTGPIKAKFNNFKLTPVAESK
jgi:hypothetical protein